MKFVLEFDELTYEELENRLEEVVSKMRNEHKSASKLSHGERYYIMPSDRDFEKWDKEDKPCKTSCKDQDGCNTCSYGSET